MMDPAELVVIGKITAVYGVKGWVKIHSYTDPMENLLGYQSCYYQRGNQWQPLIFEDVKRHGKGLVGLIEGVADREQAKSHCQSDIAIVRSDLPALDAEDFYLHQLEGLKVYSADADGNELLLGKVHQMMETGANDVVVVQACDGSIDKRERLIPWLMEQVILQVDIKAGLLRVEWDAEF